MMLRLVTDENFNGAITRGLLRRRTDLELVRVQDVGLRQTLDPMILEWAAANARVFVTHDVSTVPPAAYQRLSEGKPMHGVFIVPELMPIGQAIEELLFLATESEPDDWKDQVLYLPL